MFVMKAGEENTELEFAGSKCLLYTWLDDIMYTSMNTLDETKKKVSCWSFSIRNLSLNSPLSQKVKSCLRFFTKFIRFGDQSLLLKGFHLIMSSLWLIVDISCYSVWHSLWFVAEKQPSLPLFLTDSTNGASFAGLSIQSTIEILQVSTLFGRNTF